MKKKLIIAGLGMLPWLAASAQQQDTTLVRTVVVENEYNPTVMDASKINVLPKVEEPTVPKTHIDYSATVRPVSAWNYQAMNPIVKEWKADAAYRGYLRAGYGNNGNVDAQLGYLWDISKKDRFNVAASLDGWNGGLASIKDQDWESRLYNTRIGLEYRHAFKKLDSCWALLIVHKSSIMWVISLMLWMKSIMGKQMRFLISNIRISFMDIWALPLRIRKCQYNSEQRLA